MLVAALSFTIVIALSQHAPAQAGRGPVPQAPEPLLPQTVGIAVATDATVTIPFGAAVDPKSVERAIQVIPAQDVRLSWSSDNAQLTVAPATRWRADERYLVVIGGAGAPIDRYGLAYARRYSFTTQPAPAVTEFQVRLASPETADGAVPTAADASARDIVLEAAESALAVPEAERAVADDAVASVPDGAVDAVSASTSISIDFSEPMNHADVEAHFAIAPAVAGSLSWEDETLVFTPTERLAPGNRYTVSVIGAHDARENVIGGTANFSFTVQRGAQITRGTPGANASNVESPQVEVWFSAPMEVGPTNAAFRLMDTVTAGAVAGELTWNETHTQLTFRPSGTLVAGRTYSVVFAEGARDADGNPLATKWSFTTRPVAIARSAVTTRSAPAIPPAAPATTLAGYALNQVNAARSAYGLPPLVLDGTISAVASSHAMDQAANGYFSHVGLDGSTREARLGRGGVGFGWSAENQCYHIGLSQQATLNWCHAQFMAEPYPGQWNHIANILSPNARRMGIGIATVGGKTIITWDFTD